jgi:hypothetical protein
MHNLMSAVSRRSVGLAAGVVLAGGLAGGVLLTPGTAFASVGTTTALSASVSSGTVNITVDVTPAGSATMWPTGTVRVATGFGASSGCYATLAQDGAGTTGTGSCSISGLAAGNYSLQASYHGDANFGGSTSNSVRVTINASTSVPAFTAASPSLTGTSGDSYSYNFNASGNPAPDYSLSGPGWLHIDWSSGAVSGTIPDNITSFSYSVGAKSSAGSASAGPFTVEVSHHRGHPGGPGGGQQGGHLTTSLHCTSPVHSGAQGTCTLDVTNSGSGRAQSVTGTINLPSQLKADFCGHGWGWGWYNSWGCSISGNTVTETLGTLNPGQSRDVTVTFTAQSTHYLWGYGHQYREWVKVTGSAQSSDGYFWSPGWWGFGNSSNSSAYVQILPPHFWW